MTQEEKQQELIDRNAEWLYERFGRKYGMRPWVALSIEERVVWIIDAECQNDSVLVPAGLGWMQMQPYTETNEADGYVFKGETRVFRPLTKQGETK